MATKDDDVLSLGVNVNVKDALREMNRFQKEMGKQIDSISKKMGAFQDANKKATKLGVKSTEELTDAVDDLSDAFEKETKIVQDLERRLADAHEDEKAALEDELRLLREANKERKKVKAAGGSGKKGGLPGTGHSAADLKKMWVGGAKDAVGEFKSGIRAVFSKDLKGAVEGAFKGSAKTINTIISGTFNTAATGLFKGGKGLAKMGAGMTDRGKARGGAGGMAMQAAGGGMKVLGGLMTKMGPLLQMFAKLGPLISTLSSAVLAIVKVFIDAEAQAKQFQKEVLQSASTVEFLGEAGGNTAVAFDNLETTVKGVRDAAYSLENLKWGITADDHKAVVNVLNQEGVSLNRIGQEARMSNKSVKDFASELTHVSVAYSRAFGVPLQEINQLQAEMMTDLGMSLDETRLAFSQMTRAASDSGISANKFFAIIRGVSQDLSLYNNRMEDAVRMLKMLGKVMNPREAQKFMSTAMQGLKSMGRQERLRMTLLTGSGKMAKLVERDTKRKQESIAKTISEHTGKSIADIEATLAKGPMAVDGLIKQLPDEVQGSIREGLTELDLQKSRGSKGVFGISGAAANLGPAASLQAMQSALASWGGGKTLREGAGTIGMEMMADNLGISQEQLDQMIKFEGAIDRQRALLLDQLKNGDTQQKTQAREALKRAGITAKNDEELAKTIDQAGYDQIMDTLDEGTKEQLKNDTKVVNFAQKQANLTQSLLDKLGVLVDFVMNEIYNVLLDLYQMVIMAADKIGVVDAKSYLQDAANRKTANKTGVKEIMDAMDKGGAGGFRAAMANSQLSKALNSALTDMVEGHKKFQDSSDEVFKLASQKRAAQKEGKGTWTAEDEKKLEMAKERKDLSEKAYNRGLKLSHEMAGGFNAEQLVDAMKMANVSGSAMEEFKSRVAGGQSTQEAMTALSLDEIADTMRKAPWVSNATEGRIADVMGVASKQLEGAGYYDSSAGKAVDPKVFEATSQSASDTAQATQDLANAGAYQKESLSVKFGPGFLGGKYKSTIEEAVLSAMRVALFEYYMYSEIEDRARVAEHLRNNPTMTPQSFAKSVSEGAKQGTPIGEVLQAPENAVGGLVTGVSGGMAVVRAAAGEGLASVGRGERIVPAGGGSTPGVNVHVNGIGGNDLAQIIRAKVIDGIAEYKRRERYT